LEPIISHSSDDWDDELDVDAPIPYTLTSLARRELAAWRLEVENPCRSHIWRVKGRQLVCDECGDELEITDSRRGYLPVKRRGD
jgi:hypothetical protein